MRSFRTSLLVSASASVAIALAQPTFAQDAQEEPAASSNAPADVIVVSANRREQNIQDAPAVITVFDDDIIDSMGVDDLGSISSLVPGLTLDGSHRDQNRLGMRGAFSAADTPSSGQAVGLYVDGVYYGRSASLGPVLFDIESVEVLKGPQGTLYGPNVVGGLINIQTRDPNLTEVEGRLSATIGNYGLRELAGRVSVPIIEDQMAASLTVVSTQSDGWLDNLVTGRTLDQEDTLAVRGKLLWEPQYNLTIEAFAEYWQDQSFGETRHLIPIDGPTSRFTAPEDFEETLIAKDASYDREVTTFGLSAIYDLTDSISLTSNTSYHETNSLGSDLPFLAGPVEFIGTTRDQSVETFTQEFLLSGSFNRLDWQTGVYFLDDTSRTPETFESIVVPGTVVFAFGYPERFVSTHDMENGTESISVFAQGTYAFTDTFNVTIGARQTSVEKDSFVETSGDAFPGNFAIEEVFTLSQTTEFDAFTPRFGFDWTLDDLGPLDTLLIYGSAVRGFRSGDFVKQTTLSTSIGTTEPEFVWSYEAGFKSTFWNGNAIFNLTYFSAEYEDLQSQVIENAFTTIVNNDGEAQGIDVEFSAQLTDEFTFGVNYSYLDTEITGGDVSIIGNRLPRSPENSFSLSGIYERELANGHGVRLTAIYTYQDESYIDINNAEPPEVHEQTQQSLLNLDATYFVGDWEFSIWGRNVLDDEVILEANDLNGIYSYTENEGFGQGLESYWNAKYMDPRTFGATVRYNF